MPRVAAAIREQFITDATDAQEPALQAALAGARSVNPKAHFRPRLKHVNAQVTRIKAAAGAGPSKLRNSHIQCLLLGTRWPSRPIEVGRQLGDGHYNAMGCLLLDGGARTTALEHAPSKRLSGPSFAQKA